MVQSSKQKEKTGSHTWSMCTFTSSNVFYSNPLSSQACSRIDVYKYSFLPQTIIQLPIRDIN